ncbi:L7Ae/L30e/S12e/Gadd45 family ribosomal protein [Pectinatus haikarae]|uniref:Ribosomal protein L7Ae-like RNA K-turn-binding protein n=1 Tax=Pectinatus haikarae TaxID=349096 RepID=A0ABT9Y6I8_9FIRM|nr:ribosomal L7Ae/L30e/S12e/Gadd45 family protein [Pectinatus haikarae]MDQ0203447.1 ribosomal protein L7Ae-like RNA K-turn-binding protein [Pectinatus haikarae]
MKDNMLQNLLNLLSMASRANKIISGDFAIGKAAAGGKVRLLLVAGDTAQNTSLEYKEIASKYSIPLIFLTTTKTDLGHCIGKNERAAVAVCDEGFMKAVTKILK